MNENSPKPPKVCPSCGGKDPACNYDLVPEFSFGARAVIHPLPSPGTNPELTEQELHSRLQCKRDEITRVKPTPEAKDELGIESITVHQALAITIELFKRNQRTLELLEEENKVLRDGLVSVETCCLCDRNTFGFDYNEEHPLKGFPKPGARWLTPQTIARTSLAKADEIRSRITKRSVSFRQITTKHKENEMKDVMLVDGSMEEGFEVIVIDQEPEELLRQIKNLSGNAEVGQEFKLTFAKYTQRQIDESNIRGEYWGGHFDEAEMNRRMAALET